CEHVHAPLLFLPEAGSVSVAKIFHRSELLRKPLLLLGTNGRGAMLRIPAAWGELNSRYDAILAANLNPAYPEDRWIMLTRCRAWLVYQDYSQDICLDCLHSLVFDRDSRGIWHFRIPAGQGQHVELSVRAEMIPQKNAVRIVFYRRPARAHTEMLADNRDVRLILRPDIEDRNFHETTKAYSGPENRLPTSVTAHPQGFTFAPGSERLLEVQVSKGNFVLEPEWQYMVHRPLERERGLDPDSDLFSPGYFSASLKGKASLELLAQIPGGRDRIAFAGKASLQEMKSSSTSDNGGLKPIEALMQALDSYVVQRGSLKTVIAGYPWFLDWGRDALIFVRGLIAAQKTENARAILKQFGQYELHGTLPNMIRGKDAGNRDTSDAPLWFFLACAELVGSEGNDAFLDEPCGDRTTRQILISIGRALMAGTPNGIRTDPESGLIFSPGHFTWMDTNHPAGTPREGYPVEIQALWHQALMFLAQIDRAGARNGWKKLAATVQSSLLKLFVLKKEGYLSDCLHAGSGMPANQAEPDDALRPNQLLAVTLGAVSDVDICRGIVTACEELLVPGAIRSLANRPVRRPLAVAHQGTLLNHPFHPYQGRYTGDEDTRRKPAYHNGTAWTWVFPSFCEAWVKTYGEKGKNTALAWLASTVRLINQGCAGHVPEILDGDFPHTPRGCDAQAWGASELLRVWLLLSGQSAGRPPQKPQKS
ncbi:MAG: amylo-alpha-1,6-glucosidase, partial [Proteobacteria bacterium]|nr:amylo-alpha-1,6-glucosidase [Pseudomonadota bacterium]